MSALFQDRSQVHANFKLERGCQGLMDADYRHRGHTIVSRQGTREYDVILLRHGQHEEKIEEKFRDMDYGDLLVELVQDVTTGDLGWYYHTRCDFLHYAICPNWNSLSHYWRIAWRPFTAWFCDTYLASRRFLKTQTSAAGYGLTLNIPVPLRDIPDALKQRCEARLSVLN